VSSLKELSLGPARRTCQGAQGGGAPPDREGSESSAPAAGTGDCFTGFHAVLVSLPSYAAGGLSGMAGFSRLQLQPSPMPGLSLNLTDSEGVAYKGELRNVQISRHEAA